MSGLRSISRRIALGAGALTVISVSAPAQSVSYVGGLQYASGDFIFTERTWSAYLWNGLSWSEGRLRASATIPLVMQGSGWLRYSGAGMMVRNGGASGSRPGDNQGMETWGSSMHAGGMMAPQDMPFSRVGVGDPIGRIEVATLSTAGERAVLKLVGAVKAPLASAGRGFGTGAWDIGTGAVGLLRTRGATVTAEAVYWKIGDPARTPLRNAVAYGVSVGRPLSGGRWSVLAAVSGASSVLEGLTGPAQAGLGFGYVFESGGSVFATAAAGLTRTAPAFSTGVGWRLPLGKAASTR